MKIWEQRLTFHSLLTRVKHGGYVFGDVARTVSLRLTWPPAHPHRRDRYALMWLLRNSISLAIAEKARIVCKYPDLDDDTIDGLRELLQEEFDNFVVLTGAPSQHLWLFEFEAVGHWLHLEAMAGFRLPEAGQHIIRFLNAPGFKDWSKRRQEDRSKFEIKDLGSHWFSK